jgi:hypothetical protein
MKFAYPASKMIIQGIFISKTMTVNPVLIAKPARHGTPRTVNKPLRKTG